MAKQGLMDKLDAEAVGQDVAASHSEEEEDSLAGTEPVPTDEDLNSDTNAPQTLGEPRSPSTKGVDLASSPAASSTQGTEEAPETGDKQVQIKTPEVDPPPPHVSGDESPKRSITPVDVEKAAPAPTGPSIVAQQLIQIQAFMNSDLYLEWQRTQQQVST